MLEQDVPDMVHAYASLEEFYGYKTEITESRHELHLAVKGYR